MKPKSEIARIVILIVTWAAMGVFSVAHAAHSPNHKRAGSYDIDIGVVPAEQARASEPQMGAAAHRDAVKRDSYHLVVSLRDINSGQHVADAVVRARVGPRWIGSGTTKLLESMTINDSASYGNYFVIPGRNPFKVHLWIERPGAPASRSEAVFSLRRN